MTSTRHVSIAALLLLAAGCAGPSTPSHGAASSPAASTSEKAQTRMVCESVRSVGSHISYTQCREVSTGNAAPRTLLEQERSWQENSVRYSPPAGAGGR